MHLRILARQLIFTTIGVPIKFNKRVMPKQQSISRFFSGSLKISGTKKINNAKITSESHKSKEIQPNNKRTTPPAAEPIIKKQKTESLEDQNGSEPETVETKEETDSSEIAEMEEEEEEGQSKSKELREADELIKLTENEQQVYKHEKLSAKIPYSKLTEVFERIENESSRLKITSIVSQFFLEALEQSTSDKLVKIVYLFINRLGPDYEPDLELGLGETLLIKAISECYGRPTTKIKKDYHEVGDLGIVAQKSRSSQPTMFKPTALDIDTVFDNLTKIAKSIGKDSQSRKISTINKMLTACELKSNEAKYLIRSLEGKLRIGLAEKTVLIGLAQAFVNYELKKSDKRINPEKLTSAEGIIREAFSQVPNYEVIINTAYKFGIFNLLDHCQLTPGIPLRPMLAKPTKSVTEILDRFQGQEFTSEYKYDGERAQVHLLANGEVRIYSRNSEDMSQRYPDLISIIKEFKKRQEGQSTTSMILDCEAVAWDREAGKILPFQILSTRKRKDVEEKDIKVHICLFAFDILYYNDQSLIAKSLSERRDVMYKHLEPIDGKFQFATAKNISNLDEVQQFLDQSVKDSCEGLMVKMLHGPESYYEPSKRSRNWLKLKKDYLDGVGDSLDLVVIGAYIGRGKRTGAYGGFLLASYNQDSGEYETACKIGTGFSDEDLASIHSKLKPTEITAPKPYYVYDTNNSNAVPDVWFEPTMIFEVLTADLSLSPIYKAGRHQYGKGISLRFPRFIRIRDDKGIENATTSTEVIEFYERQVNLN